MAAAAAAGIVAYAYVGYPTLLRILAVFRRREAPRREPIQWPQLTITLPVYNEAPVIADTLDTILTLDYPRDRMHVLVVSDASTDGTDEIVSQYADRGVQLVRMPERLGKTAAENAARNFLKGDIVVNTDASVRLHPQALKPLVAALADPSVGIASGRDVSVARQGDNVNVGESGYVGYEMWVRDLETRAGGIVGASGCFFASRRSLHEEIVPAALSRDFAAPLIARRSGLKAVSVNDAVCYVPRAPSLRREYTRKVRTMTRGLETLYYLRRLMNPFRYGLFAWMLFSHKFARWMVPWAVATGAVALVLLSREHGWAQWSVGLGSVAVVMALAAWVWPRNRMVPKVFAVPAYVVFGILAGLHAWINALRGDLTPMWEPTRRDP